MSLIFRCEMLSASISTANFLSDSSMSGGFIFRKIGNFRIRVPVHLLSRQVPGCGFRPSRFSCAVFAVQCPAAGLRRTSGRCRRDRFPGDTGIRAPCPGRYRIEFILMLALTSAIALMRLIATSLSAWCGFWLTSFTYPSRSDFECISPSRTPRRRCRSTADTCRPRRYR